MPTELAPVLATLRSKGFRMTAQREAIVAAVLRARGHINPGDLLRDVRKKIDVDPSTVYRTLAMLDEVGVLSHAHLEDGVEYHRANESPHAHLKCSNCGKTLNLSAREVEPVEDAMETRYGFRPDLTHFAIAGLCSDCRAERPSPNG